MNEEPARGSRGTEAERELTRLVIGAAIAVHRELGPGLLESTYRVCLERELRSSGLAVEVERAIPLIYRGVHLECGHRMDLLVEGRLIVELKATRRLKPIHLAQLLTYLRLTNLRLGLLLNFNVPKMTDGIRRIVNGYARTDT